MKFKISYFYHVRNLAPNQIPVSTAKYDPKWFHNNKGNAHVFIDKRGVINGLRLPALAPNNRLSNLCRGSSCCEDTPDSCAFLNGYRSQLEKIDFDALLKNIEETLVCVNSKNAMSTQEPECILMVYETPTNLCSERMPLIEWFRAHDIELEEYKR